MNLRSNVGYMTLEQNSDCKLYPGGINARRHPNALAFKIKGSLTPGARVGEKKTQKTKETYECGMVKMPCFPAHACAHMHTLTHSHTQHTYTCANIIAWMQNHTCTLDMSQTYLACISKKKTFLVRNSLTGLELWSFLYVHKLTINIGHVYIFWNIYIK